MKGFLKLIVYIVGIFLLVTVAIPQVNKLPLLKDLQKTVKKWDINTAAFFYTDEISTNEEIKKHTDL